MMHDIIGPPADVAPGTVPLAFRMYTDLPVYTRPAGVPLLTQ